jgi:transcriptional regulator with XRE-family HTH domain
LPSRDEAGKLGKTLGSARHKILIEFLIERREALQMSQVEFAEKMGQYQSFVARLESGQRRIDVVEFIDISEILQFDPSRTIKLLTRKV